jgi:hypothetical protein
MGLVPFHGLVSERNGKIEKEKEEEKLQGAWCKYWQGEHKVKAVLQINQSSLPISTIIVFFFFLIFVPSYRTSSSYYCAISCCH